MLRAYIALVATIDGIIWSAILVRWADAPGTVAALYACSSPGRSCSSGAAFGDRRGGVRPDNAAIAIAGGVFFVVDLALGIPP